MHESHAAGLLNNCWYTHGMHRFTALARYIVHSGTAGAEIREREARDLLGQGTRGHQSRFALHNDGNLNSRPMNVPPRFALHFVLLIL